MTVWLVWERSHEEIAVVCATEAIARRWVKDKTDETRKRYGEERVRRLSVKAELDAMPWKEKLRIWGISGYGEPTLEERGYGEPTLEERVKYIFSNPDFYNPDDVTEASWPVEEAQVIEVMP